MVNGLRIYVNDRALEIDNNDRVFYSRRADGPYYSWRHEKRSGQWRCSRVHAADFSSKTLSMSNWKAVPAALQIKLIEHYQE